MEDYQMVDLYPFDDFLYDDYLQLGNMQDHDS
jgi:hypothetical protein